ncbi:EamA-like transporter family [Seminavis robusta]|uniref:EamA-like transporter family n=1 Tax=Seminavis robusta TaxID=568900 RepID=A0A9N8H6D4_9STRA|nr:EamA-like transporter family [Seminavis robusta]|eukprot:Sro109_g054470.1 EamA-like transporter family (543) ;mRNA; r:30565-32193
MTYYSNDGSGSHASLPVPRDEESGNYATEHDGLLGSQSINNDDHEHNHGDDHQEESNLGLLGAIVEGVEYIAEQAQEAAGGFKEVIAETVETAQEAIVEEAQEVRETWVEALDAKDDGESVIFEMGLTRNLSILPGDLEDVAGVHHHEVVEDAQTILPEVVGAFPCCPEKIHDCCRPTQANLMDSPPQSPKAVKDFIDIESGEATPLVEKPCTSTSTATATVPFHAYVTLLGAVVCLSSIGPSLDLQDGVDSSMKIYWRMTGTYMALLPFAANAYVKEGLPKLTNTQWCTFVLAACCYAVMCVAFVLALDFTSVGNAVIFANSQSLLLLIGKAFVGEPISLMEGSGALVAFAGAIFCASDSTASTGNAFSTTGPVVWAGWGDLLALLSAVGGVAYLVFAKSLRQHVSSVFLFMFMIMFAGSFCVLAFLWLSGVYFTVDRDVHHGLWGFMNWQYDRLPLEVWMVVVCNLMGAMGYVRSMQYFDNLTISVATLMEPVVASFMAYGLKVGLLPNTIGWIGNLLVAAGTIAVIYPSSQGKQAAVGH